MACETFTSSVPCTMPRSFSRENECFRAQNCSIISILPLPLWKAMIYILCFRSKRSQLFNVPELFYYLQYFVWEVLVRREKVGYALLVHRWLLISYVQSLITTIYLDTWLTQCATWRQCGPVFRAVAAL